MQLIIYHEVEKVTQLSCYIRKPSEIMLRNGRNPLKDIVWIPVKLFPGT